MITGQKPLVYRNPLSHLVDSLPYIDAQPTVYKTQIIHMIKAEQQLLQIDKEDYIQDLKLPNTPFINSEQFQKLVEELKSKRAGEGPVLIPTSKIEIKDISKNESMDKIKEIIQNSEILTAQNMIKKINLELSNKLGPCLLKQQMQVLVKAKERVQKMIDVQNQEIKELNIRRKYEQIENQERIQTIKDRTRILLKKDTRGVDIPQPKKSLKTDE